jgi:hypothetical protein
MRQFAAVPTPLRKNQQALATLFSRRLGGKVKKHKWPRTPDSSAPVRRPCPENADATRVIARSAESAGLLGIETGVFIIALVYESICLG